MLKISLITCFFQPFAFFSMKTTPKNRVLTHFKSQDKGLQLLYHGKIDLKKESAYSKIERDTEMNYKRLQKIQHRLQKLDWHYKLS